MNISTVKQKPNPMASFLPTYYSMLGHFSHMRLFGDNYGRVCKGQTPFLTPSKHCQTPTGKCMPLAVLAALGNHFNHAYSKGFQRTQVVLYNGCKTVVVYRTTGVSQHLQLRTGGFYYRKVFLLACPCSWQ